LASRETNAARPLYLEESASLASQIFKEREIKDLPAVPMLTQLPSGTIANW